MYKYFQLFVLLLFCGSLVFFSCTKTNIVNNNVNQENSGENQGWNFHQDFEFYHGFNSSGPYAYADQDGNGYDRMISLSFGSNQNGLYTNGIEEIAIGINCLDGTINYEEGWTNNVYISHNGNIIWFIGYINNNNTTTWDIDVLFQHQSTTTTVFKWTYRVKYKGNYYFDEDYWYDESIISQLYYNTTAPIGAINGLYSVSPNKKVYFSKGNLQYQASTNIWRFAENQWDYVGSSVVNSPYGGEPGGTVPGSSNHLISSTYDGWIDLFGWGTSGYNHGAICYQPWSISDNNNNYNVYGDASYNLYDHTGTADWGYNAISNGGNMENIWRTLTDEEWKYLFKTRNTLSGIRFVRAIVNNVNGIIILPNNWNSSILHLNNSNDYGADFDCNIISLNDWTYKLEINGAVFLPITFIRTKTQIFLNALQSAYWSSTRRHDDNAYYVFFNIDGFVPVQPMPLSRGCSVRLVQDYI